MKVAVYFNGSIDQDIAPDVTTKTQAIAFASTLTPNQLKGFEWEYDRNDGGFTLYFSEVVVVEIGEDVKGYALSDHSEVQDARPVFAKGDWTANKRVA